MSRLAIPATLDAAPEAARPLLRAVNTQIVEHAALNTWTNDLNSVAQTEIDFPAAPAFAA